MKNPTSNGNDLYQIGNDYPQAPISAYFVASSYHAGIYTELSNTAKEFTNVPGVDNGEVLLAYKGTGVSDCGVAFCPYVTGVVNQAIDPNDFSPRVGVMSRYAFANNMLGADNYYRLLKFDTGAIWAKAGEGFTF